MGWPQDHHLFSRVAVSTTLVMVLGDSVVKNPPASEEDTGSIPGLERSPGGGRGNPLQYSCLENSMDRGA